MTDQPGFFDFVTGLSHYDGLDKPVARLNKRHGFIIRAFADRIRDARVLDLASHDGRWCHAFAAAGAASVLGIEARQELVDRYASFPETPFKSRVSLRCDDLFDGMEAEVRAGRTYDVIGVLGILYHVMDHFRLFQLARKLRPGLIIVDSEFMLRDSPVIQLVRERTDNILNAAPQIDGQEIAIKGIPSMVAMEVMAEALGYDCIWSDWNALPTGQRGGVGDYFRPVRMRRATCALVPRQDPQH